MICVKSKTDDIYQWLDSWNRASKVRYEKREENTGGRTGPSLTICRDSTSAFAIQLPGWWMVFFGVQDPRALEGHVQTDISGFFFSLRYHFAFKRFDFYVLICLRWLTYISSPCSETFFGTWMWSNYRTVWSNMTFISKLSSRFFTEPDHCPIDLAGQSDWLLLMSSLLQASSLA